MVGCWIRAIRKGRATLSPKMYRCAKCGMLVYQMECLLDYNGWNGSKLLRIYSSIWIWNYSKSEIIYISLNIHSLSCLANNLVLVLVVSTSFYTVLISKKMTMETSHCSVGYHCTHRRFVIKTIEKPNVLKEKHHALINGLKVMGDRL